MYCSDHKAKTERYYKKPKVDKLNPPAKADPKKSSR